MSERLRKTLRRRRSQLRRQTASLSTFSHWPSRKSCLPSSRYQTNSVRATPCRLACCKTAPTSSRRSLWSFLTSLYGQVRCRPFLRRHTSRRWSRSRLRCGRCAQLSSNFQSAFLSKLLESLLSRQLLDYITAEGLMPALQSAYRLFHSTETAAVLKVLADILRALDNGDVAVLTLLDVSAAFDTVDHVFLLRRLETS